MTPADRLALSVCRGGGLPVFPCPAPCSECRHTATAVAHELAAMLRERHGHSTTADWLDAIGSHTPES